MAHGTPDRSSIGHPGARKADTVPAGKNPGNQIRPLQVPQPDGSYNEAFQRNQDGGTNKLSGRPRYSRAWPRAGRAAQSKAARSTPPTVDLRRGSRTKCRDDSVYRERKFGD